VAIPYDTILFWHSGNIFGTIMPPSFGAILALLYATILVLPCGNILALSTWKVFPKKFVSPGTIKSGRPPHSSFLTNIQIYLWRHILFKHSISFLE
jgi:hypothetical protein